MPVNDLMASPGLGQRKSEMREICMRLQLSLGVERLLHKGGSLRHVADYTSDPSYITKHSIFYSRSSQVCMINYVVPAEEARFSILPFIDSHPPHDVHLNN